MASMCMLGFPARWGAWGNQSNRVWKISWVDEALASNACSSCLLKLGVSGVEKPAGEAVPSSHSAQYTYSMCQGHSKVVTFSSCCKPSGHVHQSHPAKKLFSQHSRRRLRGVLQPSKADQYGCFASFLEAKGQCCFTKHSWGGALLRTFTEARHPFKAWQGSPPVFYFLLPCVSSLVSNWVLLQCAVRHAHREKKQNTFLVMSWRSDQISLPSCRFDNSHVYQERYERLLYHSALFLLKSYQSTAVPWFLDNVQRDQFRCSIPPNLQITD